MVFKKCSVSFLIMVLVMSFLLLPGYADANQIDEKKDELGNIKEELDSQSNDLEEKKQQLEESLQDLNILEQKLAQTRRELDQLSKAVQDKEEEIQLNENHIMETEALLAERQEGLDNRLRALYQYGQTSFLEVLLASTSFSDFITRFRALQTIADNDSKIIAEVQHEKEELEIERLQLEDQKSELLNLRRAQVVKKEELDRQTSQQTVLIAKVEKEVEDRESSIKELEQEAATIEKLINRLQQEQHQLGRNIDFDIIWPMLEYQRGWITSYFGYRTHPISGQVQSFHGGLDIGIPHTRAPSKSVYNGNPVYIRAVEDGVVIYAGISGSLTYGYGRLVIIDHGGGYATVYGHAHKILVQEGQYVSRGENIAIVGTTGSSTGPHLHFEVRVNGLRENPLNYLP